ncbi:RHS repeat-associated core domain-containing protein [Sorangium sp. So ce145]|uniref:RHS repeat-associated core domain-containing protein n=1 Tax=Sorangium sp. So ce145 TaxID=3133285 RepID=UPI003F62CB27
MARTAPVPNIPAIPGMNPGVFIMGGGAVVGGRGGASGRGKARGQGASGKNGGDEAKGGGKNACGAGKDGGGCPNHHGGRGSGKIAQGDPVDVVTGRVFTVPETDVDIPGPLPLQIVRSYGSQARGRDVGLGFGWTHSLAWAIELRRRTTIVVTADGNEEEFGLVPRDAGVLGPHGWVLHKEGDGFSLDFPDGDRLLFEPDPGDRTQHRFRLAAQVDAFNNRIALTYSEGRLAQVTDSVGRVLRIRPASAGRIGQIEFVSRASGGRSLVFVRYQHDQAGDLVAVTDADGNTTKYSYDDEHRLVSQQRPTGLTFHYRYDPAGRCVETWADYPGAVDPCLAASVPALLSDGKTPAKGVHHVRLDFYRDGYSEATDSVTFHRYFSNEHGKVDKAITAGSVYTRTYDERGHLRSFTDPLGATTCWTRDVFGNETRIVDPLGNVTVIERLRNGDIRKIIDPEGSVTEVAYAERAIFWTDPIGATFEVRFDARGLMEATVAPTGHQTRYRHDEHGNLVEVLRASGTRWTAAYDELGKRTAERDESGSVTEFSYSNKGLLLAVREPNGAVTRYDYDGDENLICVTDADGRTTRLVRGGTGSLADAILPDGSVIQLRYDREERLVEIRNAKGEVYSIEVGALGLPIAERTFDGREIRYQRDALGRVLLIRRGSETTELQRDLAGRVVKKIYDDGAEEHFSYNGRGEVILAEGSGCTVELRRNAVGWVIGEKQVVDGEAFQVEVTCDRVGTALRRATSRGHAVEWAFDEAGRCTRTRLDGRDEIFSRQDELGLPVEIHLPGGGRIGARYDASGRLVARRVWSSSSSLALRPGEPEWVGPRMPNVTVDQAFQYTSAGHLAVVWDAHFGHKRFEHDALGQLLAVIPEEARDGLAARRPHAVERFRYDAAGNIHELAEGAEVRRYESGGRLETKGSTRFLYDEQGRLIEKRARSAAGDDHVTRYAWSASGMLSKIEGPDGTTVEFMYDAFARRMKKTVRQKGESGEVRLLRTTRFCWDAMTLAHEIAGIPDGEIEERTYCFDESGAPWAHRDTRHTGEASVAGPWLFYLNEAMTGYPERLVDGKGEVAGELFRTAWGKVTSKAGGSAPTQVRFLGQYEDVETGLFYNRHRYYDPDLGRYISPDPAEIDGELNAYWYARNQPWTIVDPDGLIYSRILDKDGNVLTYVDEDTSTKPYVGRNPSEGGKVTPAGHISDKPCAEAQVLTVMGENIRRDVMKEQKKVRVQDRMTPEQVDAEVNRRIKKKFQDEGLSIETYDSAKMRKRVDPCERCGAMFERLGIQEHVVGMKGKKGQYGVYRA